MNLLFFVNIKKILNIFLLITVASVMFSCSTPKWGGHEDDPDWMPGDVNVPNQPDKY